MLKNLKSLFIVEDDKSTKKSPQKAETPPPAKKTSTPTPQKTPTRQTSAGPGQVTSKFTNVLLSAMDKNNIDGFDFLEYKQSLQNLEKMDMDEATRYKSAFAMAKTMGATPDHLMKTAQFYLDILKKEEQKFNTALVSQKDKQIKGRHDELKGIDQGIVQKTKQIEQLQKEIQQLSKKKESLNASIGEASIKVETTHRNFVASYQHITRQILQDIENMKRYLK